jgi:PAS domain S-box-containing protein
LAAQDLALSKGLDDSGLSQLLNIIPEAVLAVDKQQRIRYFNKRSEETFGYGADEVLGQPLSMLLPESAREQHEHLVHQFAGTVDESQDNAWRPTMSGRHKSGRDFPFDSTICRLEIDGANYFAAVLHDISSHKHTELALRQSEESYRVLIETSIQGMLIQQDQRMVLVNRAFAAMTGYEIDELPSINIDDLRHPDDIAKIRKRQATLAQIGEYEIDDARLMRKDGSTIWLQIRVRAVEWQGRPARLITAIDATERKLADEEARRQRQYLTTSERLAGVGSWGRRLDSDKSFWSDEYYRILGAAPGSIKPEYQSLLAYVHPDDRARLDGRRQKFISDGKGFSEEIRIVRANGDVRIAVAQWEMLQDDDGRPIEFSGSMQDITEQRAAEAELRDSEKRLRDIAENSPLALLITRRGDGTILFANRRVEPILGVPAEQILGRDIKKFYWRPKDRKAWALQVDQEIQVDNKPLQMRRADGVRIATRHSLRSVTYDGEQAIMGVFEDVTERLELEDRLRQAQKVEAVGQLTGGIAHDFNNLLAVIMGNLAHLQENPTIDQDAMNLVGSALAAAERGASLTHRLLAFARRQPLAPQATNLNSLINGMDDLLRRSLGGDIKIDMKLADDLCFCKIDTAQMENAVLNLAINGRDAMDPGGGLIIATSNLDVDQLLQFGEEVVQPGRYVVLSVTDTGTGMSGEVMRQAFDPFFTTKEVGKGSGLGLSMVYGFIRQSDGYLRLESKPGQGTTISMLLPQVTPDS